jgi:hypothetical protein
MTRARSGGGILGKNVSEVSAPKREPYVDNISPNRPSQIGMSVHYHKSDLYQSSTSPKGPNPVVGSECKPGGGRTVLPSGTQSSSRPAPSKIAHGRSLFK